MQPINPKPPRPAWSLDLTHLALRAALPMAHTSKVEERIKMILDDTRRRNTPRRFLTLAAVAGAAALVPLSMLRPAVQAAPPPNPPQAAQVQPSGAPPFHWARETQYARENAKFLRGQRFSPQEAAVQEKQLLADPNDYTAHLCLLGYYLHSTLNKTPLPAAAATPAYRTQVFWLIQNHPEPLLFSAVNTSPFCELSRSRCCFPEKFLRFLGTTRRQPLEEMNRSGRRRVPSTQAAPSFPATPPGITCCLTKRWQRNTCFGRRRWNLITQSGRAS